ncbi:VOC family protein [Aliiglaciecola sp. LCG003]|uniref:VOC family protein n=1 Tax=Aliiglaciecola sp. LCG003 TaxID=3053655 RepID=UPI00257238CB|nr:VOC family protein [Aliiglaciecola sp. LCG003]WJG10303.1 VOC family protein [Aliiglaciecola sp. LCG003]
MEFSGTTLLVSDQQQALRFFTEILGFKVRADVTFENNFRWLTVSPGPEAQTALILSQASEEDKHLIGNQVGTGVLMVLLTQDFDSKYADMRGKGVIFDEPPRSEVYGKVVIFRDLCGNRWDLLQPA